VRDFRSATGLSAGRAVALTILAIVLATATTACGQRTPARPAAAAQAVTRPTEQPAPSQDDTRLSSYDRPRSVAAPSTVTRPPIIRRYIPFPAKRKREMAAYARRHYGIDSYRLSAPHVIVEHFTVTDSVRATYDTFAPDVPDVELHELPGVCSHFVIARSGTIYQLVPLGLMCRHTVGLNYTALGIEHVGRSDQDVLRNARQLRASLRLTNWLRCRSQIKLEDVIGHSESRSSPYHHENVARLRSQTHDDWTHADMQVYRRDLRRLHCGG
jgi:N-acetylmuramoyl-L-alanine amidase